MKQRPLGVTIFGILLIIASVARLLAGVVYWSRQASHLPTEPYTAIDVLSGLISGISGVGLLMVQNWARLIVLVLGGYAQVIGSGFGVVVFFFTDFQQKRLGGSLPTYQLSVVLGQLLAGCVIAWYFRRPSVRPQFQRK